MGNAAPNMAITLRSLNQWHKAAVIDDRPFLIVSLPHIAVSVIASLIIRGQQLRRYRYPMLALHYAHTLDFRQSLVCAPEELR